MVRYTTIDYLRDSYGLFNDFYEFSFKFRKVFDKFVHDLKNIEYETILLNVIGNIPYAAVIIFLGFFAVFNLFKFTERDGGYRIATITTKSMDPAIAPGSIIVSMPSAKYDEGDIISYRELNMSSGYPTGRTVSHRIIDVKHGEAKTAYITKGDSNEFPDPGEVNSENVFGKVVSIVPVLGYLDVILRSVPGFLVLIAVPALWVVRSELKFIRRQISVS